MPFLKTKDATTLCYIKPSPSIKQLQLKTLNLIKSLNKIKNRHIDSPKDFSQFEDLIHLINEVRKVKTQLYVPIELINKVGSNSLKEVYREFENKSNEAAENRKKIKEKSEEVLKRLEKMQKL